MCDSTVCDTALGKTAGGVALFTLQIDKLPYLSYGSTDGCAEAFARGDDMRHNHKSTVQTKSGIMRTHAKSLLLLNKVDSCIFMLQRLLICDG